MDDAAGLRVEANDDFIAEGVSDADLASQVRPGEGQAGDAAHRGQGQAAGGRREDRGAAHRQEGAEGGGEEGREEGREKPGEEKTEYYYVRLEGENTVERVPAAKVKPLLDVIANPDPLRSRDLVATGGPAKIDAVNIKYRRQRRQAAPGRQQVDDVPRRRRPTDAEAVNELIDALTGDNPVHRTRSAGGEDVRGQGRGRWSSTSQAAVVSVWIDGVKKEEKKDEEKKEGDKKDDDKKDEKRRTTRSRS